MGSNAPTFGNRGWVMVRRSAAAGQTTGVVINAKYTPTFTATNWVINNNVMGVHRHVRNKGKRRGEWSQPPPTNVQTVTPGIIRCQVCGMGPPMVRNRELGNGKERNVTTEGNCNANELVGRSNVQRKSTTQRAVTTSSACSAKRSGE